MLIMKNSTETITYWEETKHVPDSDLDRISTIRRSASNSPMEPSCYEPFCKEENLLYPAYDRNFNFSANAAGGTSEDDEYHQPSPKRKITVTRDPMSHRIIEKRRRDRMNNCLADLSRLIPAEYLKKGRGRIEKTEIIEMAIKHMKYLQASNCSGADEACDMSDNIYVPNSSREKQFVNGTKVLGEPELSSTDHYKLGYQECLAETMRFLVELQGFFPTDTLCVKLINHLQKYFEKLAKGEKLMTSIRESVVLQPSELERKANEYSRMTVEVGRNMANSASDSINSDDSYQENTLVDGRLQEMHAGSHYSSLYMPSVAADVHSQSSPESSSSQQDLNDAQSSNSSMYKYKNCIRERFEHSNSDKRAVPSLVICSKKRKADSTNILNAPPPIPQHPPKCGRPVPIFALHAKGSFYVPLTIDSHLLSPFGAELNDDYGVQGFSPLLLHPVTISVNFNRPLLQSPSSPILSSNLGLPAALPSASVLMVSECR